MPHPLVFLFLAVAANALAQIVIKHGLNRLGELNWSAATAISTMFQVFTNGWVMSGIIACVISLAAWVVALSKLELSVAYPMVSVSYILTAIAGYYIFNESLSPERLAGILLITTGAFLLGRTI